MKRVWNHPVFPYAAPFSGFMVMLVINKVDPRAVYITYPLMVLVVGWLIGANLKRLPSLMPSRFWPSVLLGILGTFLWVGLYPWLSEVEADPAQGFNPTLFEQQDIQWGLIFFRLLGFALIVPVMEEIFWRGFLMRYLNKEDFESVPLGTYTAMSFWVTTALLVSAHLDEWGVALLWGTMAGWWFIRTRNVGNVIVLHAVTNLLIGIYVVATGKWYFW
jgi:CAAX prenyl protease-like protein